MGQLTAHSDKPTDDPTLFRAVSLLLTDLCTLRFETLVQGGTDALEAAERVMTDLSRYDFLEGLTDTDTDYPALKKEIEMNLSTMAGRITEEENPR